MIVFFMCPKSFATDDHFLYLSKDWWQWFISVQRVLQPMTVTYICPKSFSIDNLKATNPEQHGSASPQSASFSQAWPEKIKKHIWFTQRALFINLVYMNKKHVWSRQRPIWSIRRKNTSGLDKNQHSSGLYEEKTCLVYKKNFWPTWKKHCQGTRDPDLNKMKKIMQPLLKTCDLIFITQTPLTL